MHTFRAVKTTDEYRHMLGVTTVRHETARMLEVKAVKSDHPIMKGFPELFKTPVIVAAWATTAGSGRSANRRELRLRLALRPESGCGAALRRLPNWGMRASVPLCLCGCIS